MTRQARATRGEERTAGESLRPEDISRRGAIWGRWIGLFLAHVVWRTRVVGQSHVPRTGAVILAANHTGVIDGPVLAGASPRGSHIIVKQEMFRGVIGAILRFTGQIPVDRSSGRSALAAALALLDEGRVVGIFPEGARGTGDVATAQAGIAWLAVRSGAPVVPVAILGTRPAGRHVGHVPRFRSRLHVVFGEPFQAVAEGAGTGRAALAASMQTIQSALVAHVQAATEHTGVGLPEDGPDVGGGAVDEGVADPETQAASDASRSAGHEVKVSRWIAAPPAAVWHVLTDLEAAADTLSGVTRIEVLTEGPYAVGTRWRETRRLMGKEGTEEMWVTAVEPERRTVVEAESGGTHYASTFALSPSGGGTRLDVTFGGRTTSPSRVQRVLWTLFGPLGLRVTRKALQQDVRDIATAARERPDSA